MSRGHYWTITVGADRTYWAPDGDLGRLSRAAGEISRRSPPGEYPIAADGVPWGRLAVAGPGRWEIRADDDSVRMTPGMMII
jgi:hypothetical protein